MNFGLTRNNRHLGIVVLALTLALAAMLALAPRAALAQDSAPAATAQAAAPAADAAGSGTDAAATDRYVPMKPTPGKGMPIAGGIDVQHQYSPIGHTAKALHNGLVWVMAIISGFVFLLFLIVIIRFNKRANPVPSKTTHNTTLEVVWTLVPVLILVGIAVPSISLLAKQFEVPPKNALTVKATGYQWYWGYTYPDNGGFEVISNMLPDDQAAARGEPRHLAVDNRMVVPAGVPIRMQTTGADVIHSFAVPSLWFKLDAVPGRINEKVLQIDEPGVYYGQCSELCGARHGYMPITVEALPMDKFEEWVREQGGTVGGDNATPAADAPAAADAAAEAKPAA